MSRTTERAADRVGRAVATAVQSKLDHLEQTGVARSFDIQLLADRVTAAATDAAATEAQRAADNGSPVAARIGPVYTVTDLQRWLTPPGSPDLSPEAVRKRAKKRQLVAFLTDDHHWAFPAWQFDRVGGHLLPRDAVIALWQQLPTSGFLTDVDLAVWMATRLRSLEGTPAAHVAAHGADSPVLQHALSRLTARAA